MRNSILLVALLFFLVSSDLIGQSGEPTTPPRRNWFENINIRGYGQIRYNGLIQSNDDLRCEQCDRSWGDGGFFMRRMRIIFFGNVHPRVYIYIQPDFASSVSSTSLNYAQIRDAYMDVGLDDKNEFRFRIGQSKVPFGFENMQSSSNRLPLDRNDALNSALRNERDMGIFFYWAPAEVREIFSMLNREGLKGSGDYGVFGFGAFNGQTASRPELNDNKHLVVRFSYPFRIGDQIIEPGIQAYTGKYVLNSNQISTGVTTTADRSYLDQRAAASFILYPKPFGIQAEYNIGTGPEFNKVTDAIESNDLKGGYATISYMMTPGNQRIYPFLRYQKYDGGKKHELDARSYEVEEFEIGIEWLPVRNFELVAMYTFSKRRFEDFNNQDNLQQGSLLRLQAQVNF